LLQLSTGAVCISFEGKSSLPEGRGFEEIVKHAVTHAPSTFNSQSARAVVLLEDAHRRLWDMVLEILRGIIKSG